jgi:hypothetical protein
MMLRSHREEECADGTRKNKDAIEEEAFGVVVCGRDARCHDAVRARCVGADSRRKCLGLRYCVP